MYVLGYKIPAHKKISLADRDISVYTRGLPLAVAEYSMGKCRQRK